jgi:isoleucyl-tRNA synthetase
MLRNTLRYQLSNLYDFDPARHRVGDDELTPLDRWVLAKFARLEAEVGQAYEDYDFHLVYQKLSQFAAVELSAMYHDAIKDRLYTDPADSRRRRSTQSALHRMVASLCQMLSPVLVFTADEAWEFIPAKSTDSVHLSRWILRESPSVWTDDVQFDRLWEVRPTVLAELEKLRRDKVIGKALEAEVIVRGTVETPAFQAIQQFKAEFQEILGVSAVSLAISQTPGQPLQFAAAKAAGQKCERCWHWETDIGAHAAHPTLCGRCVSAVSPKA